MPQNKYKLPKVVEDAGDEAFVKACGTFHPESSTAHGLHAAYDAIARAICENLVVPKDKKLDSLLRYANNYGYIVNPTTIVAICCEFTRRQFSRA